MQDDSRAVSDGLAAIEAQPLSCVRATCAEGLLPLTPWPARVGGLEVLTRLHLQRAA